MHLLKTSPVVVLPYASKYTQESFGMNGSTTKNIPLAFFTRILISYTPKIMHIKRFSLALSCYYQGYFIAIEKTFYFF